jgi:hypothetical protein
MAHQVLLTQANNRNIAKSRIIEYRRRMERGEWVLAEPWLFDQCGHLIDGQHRATALAALKDHSISIPVLMIQGWPDETQSAVDIGFNRNIASIAQLQGVDFGSRHLSVMNSMMLFAPNGSRKTFKSPAQAIEAYQAMKESIDFAVRLRGGDSSRFFAPVRAVVALAYPYENHNKLDRFLEVWDSMIARNAIEQPIAKLRSQHEIAPKPEAGGSEYRKFMARRTVAALWAFLKDQPLKVIREKDLPWPGPDMIDGKLFLPGTYYPTL